MLTKLNILIDKFIKIKLRLIKIINQIIYLIIINVFLIYPALAISYTEGRQYINLHTPITCKPQILEFFSFYCLNCYYFEQVLNNLKNVIPHNTQIIKYHIDLGLLGKQLTQAWTVAIILGIEDKVSPLLFDAIHIKQSPLSVKDIYAIFNKLNINKQKYDNIKNSIQVRSLILKQNQSAVNLKLMSIPTILINGKYMIKNDGINASSICSYNQQLSDLIKFLINRE